MPPIKTNPFPIQPPIHRSQHGLQHHIRTQPLPTLPFPWHRIHNIPPSAHLRQSIVQFPQRFRRTPFLPNLEELNANLPRGRIPAVELLGRGDDDALNVVGRDAVGDDDDVERLDVVGAFALEGGEVGFQDGVEAGAGRGAATGADGLENGVDVDGASDVSVLAAVFFVEEVDVDAVGVVGGADGRDGFERLRGFFPGAAGHGARVID